MPATSNLAALPRQELALAVVEGEGIVKNLVGEKILGPLGLSYRNAHLIKATLGTGLGLRQISNAKYQRAMGSVYQRVTATLADLTLTATPRGVELQVPKEMMLDYDKIFDVQAYFSGLFGTVIGALTKEILIANVIFSSSAYLLGSATNSGVAYTGTNRDSLGATGMNPIQDIIASARRIRNNGEVPDTVIMSGQVWERVRTCQNTMQFCVGQFGPIMEVTEEMFRKALTAFGITQVLIGDNYYNSSADGVEPAAGALTPVWSNTYMVICKAGMEAPNDAEEGQLVQSLRGLGANLFWEGFDASGKGTNAPVVEDYDFAGGGGYYVETYPEWSTKSDVIRFEMSHNPTITNNRCGDIIATQYS